MEERPEGAPPAFETNLEGISLVGELYRKNLGLKPAHPTLTSNSLEGSRDALADSGSLDRNLWD